MKRTVPSGILVAAVLASAGCGAGPEGTAELVLVGDSAFPPAATHDNRHPAGTRIEVESFNDFEVRISVQEATSAPAPGRTSRADPDTAERGDIP